MSRFCPGVLSFIMFFVLPGLLLAAEPPANDDSQKQTVLFLTIADETDAAQWESSFLSELELALDTASVRAITPDTDVSFDSIPIDKQVTQIRPLLKAHDASAAIWVTRREESLTLHVVVISKGRALVRLVEADAHTSQSHMAAAARELALTAHLFENTKTSQSNWGVSILGTFRSGLGDVEGPNTWAGGSVGLERHLTGGLSARFWLGAVGGPSGSSQGLEAGGFALQVGIGAAYLWELGPLSLGPMLGLQSEWSNVALRAGSGPEQRSSEWQTQILTNIEFRFHVTQSLGIVAGGGILTTPHQDIYRRESDDIVTYSTPFVSLNAFLGVIILLN